MSYRIILLIGVATLFFQCESKNGKDDFNTIETLNYEEVSYPIELGRTHQLMIEKNILLLNDFHGDSVINVFDLNTSHIIRRLVGVGNGPNELKSPIDIQNSDNYIYIYGRPFFTLLRVKKENLDTSPLIIEKLPQLPKLGDRILPLTDSLIVFSGMWGKRYALVNINDPTKILEFGDYPDMMEGEKDLPIEVKMMFHQSKFAKHPKETLFISCSDYTAEIYEYNINGEEPILKLRKLMEKYDYSFVSGQTVATSPNKENSPRIRAVTTSNKYICIVMGKKGADRETEIKIFDWEMKPIKKMVTDKYMMTMTIDDTNTAYAIIQDPEDMVVKFKLD